MTESYPSNNPDRNRGSVEGQTAREIVLTKKTFDSLWHMASALGVPSIEDVIVELIDPDGKFFETFATKDEKVKSMIEFFRAISRRQGPLENAKHCVAKPFSGSDEFHITVSDSTARALESLRTISGQKTVEGLIIDVLDATYLEGVPPAFAPGPSNEHGLPEALLGVDLTPLDGGLGVVLADHLNFASTLPVKQRDLFLGGLVAGLTGVVSQSDAVVDTHGTQPGDSSFPMVTRDSVNEVISKVNSFIGTLSGSDVDIVNNIVSTILKEWNNVHPSRQISVPSHLTSPNGFAESASRYVDHFGSDQQILAKALIAVMRKDTDMSNRLRDMFELDAVKRLMKLPVNEIYDAMYNIVKEMKGSQRILAETLLGLVRGNFAGAEQFPSAIVKVLGAMSLAERNDVFKSSGMLAPERNIDTLLGDLEKLRKSDVIGFNLIITTLVPECVGFVSLRRTQSPIKLPQASALLSQASSIKQEKSESTVTVTVVEKERMFSIMGEDMKRRSREEAKNEIGKLLKPYNEAHGTSIGVW